MRGRRVSSTHDRGHRDTPSKTTADIVPPEDLLASCCGGDPLSRWSGRAEASSDICTVLKGLNRAHAMVQWVGRGGVQGCIQDLERGFSIRGVC